MFGGPECRGNTGDITDPESTRNTDTNPAYVVADGWYLPDGEASVMFHSRRHGAEAM